MAKRKAKLSTDELLREISNRTSLSMKDSLAVLCAYFDIMEEALINKVETPIGHIGVLSWKTTPPKEYVEWIYTVGPKKGEKYIATNVDGYDKPCVRISKSFRDMVKQKSIVPYDANSEYEEDEEDLEDD